MEILSRRTSVGFYILVVCSRMDMPTATRTARSAAAVAFSTRIMYYTDVHLI